MQTKCLYLFTDDSGTAKFGRDDDSVFSLCTVVIDEQSLIESDEKFSAFKRTFGEKLGIEIGTLHDNEIENGLRRGKGKYRMLKTNRALATDFIRAMNALLQDCNYRLISIVFETQPYLAWLDAEVEKYYQGQKVKCSPEPTAIFFTTYFFQLKHIFVKKLHHDFDQLRFFMEERGVIKPNDKGFLETAISVLFSQKDTQLVLGVQKNDDDYRSAMELADLCANTLRKQLINPKWRRMHYDVISSKVLLNKKLSVQDFINTFGELKKASLSK